MIKILSLFIALGLCLPAPAYAARKPAKVKPKATKPVIGEKIPEPPDDVCPPLVSTVPTTGYRVGSWSLRWFPEGVKPNLISEARAVFLVACTLRHLNVDALALQGLTKKAYPAWNKVMEKLDKWGRASWKTVFDTCPGNDRQHVAIAYRTELWNVRDLKSIESTNPSLKLCGLDLYPGVGGHFKHRQGGSFYFVSLHLASGTTAQAHAQRIASLLGLSQANAIHIKKFKEPDIIAAGVINPDGCEDNARGCVRPLNVQGEIETMAQVLNKMTPSFSLYWSGGRSEPVSRLFQKRSDAFIVSTATREVQHKEISSLQQCPEQLPVFFKEQLDDLAFITDRCPLALPLSHQDQDAPAK
jgi:hypothetical protein